MNEMLHDFVLLSIHYVVLPKNIYQFDIKLQKNYDDLIIQSTGRTFSVINTQSFQIVI